MISKEVLARVAANARLALTDEEIEKLLPQFEEILKAFAQLDEVDTKGVPQSFHPISVKDVSRPDDPAACLEQEQALSLTPHRKGGYFRGPKIL